jgi:hypothetical protein
MVGIPRRTHAMALTSGLDLDRHNPEATRPPARDQVAMT